MSKIKFIIKWKGDLSLIGNFVGRKADVTFTEEDTPLVDILTIDGVEPLYKGDNIIIYENGDISIKHNIMLFSTGIFV